MLDQGFGAKSLLRILDVPDIIKFKIGREKSEYLVSLEDVSKEILSEDFDFTTIKKVSVKAKDAFSVTSRAEHFALKKISNNLRRLYKINLKNRDDISEQILKIFQSSNSFNIIKVDIKKFFENVNFSYMLNKLEQDSLLSPKCMSILEKLQKKVGVSIPRGLSISPVLAEIYIRQLDHSICSLPSVYYYSRYVDDIIIICLENSDSVFDHLLSALSELKLGVNDKTKRIAITKADGKLGSECLDYLGYRYEIRRELFNSKRVVNVSLTRDKINKIKSRIVYSILDRGNLLYSDEQNAMNLFDRINLLSGNYVIKNKVSGDETLKELKAGIFYSNKLVNDKKVFDEFNIFIKKALFSKVNSIGRIVAKISKLERKLLLSLCFVDGFSKKKSIEYSRERMIFLKGCWKNRVVKKK